MSNYEVIVSDGPDMDELTRASSVPRMQVSFHTDEGILSASVEAMQELDDQPAILIRGRIAGGLYEDRIFIGSYDPQSRRGSLQLESVP
jgi:hypothetical protein